MNEIPPAPVPAIGTLRKKTEINTAHEESSGAHCKIEEVIVSNEELKKLLVGKVEAEAKERIADDPVCWIRSNLHLAQALWIPGNGEHFSPVIAELIFRLIFSCRHNDK